jgi:arylsulfatase A-like enzyme
MAETDAERFEGVIGRYLSESTPWWPAPERARPGTPNVIVIVLDDVGFADLGCYGSTIATPNLDRLAAGGLRYTNFHCTPMCSPTRACLLTGRNHHSAGMASLANFDTGFPGGRGAITPRAGTLAQILKRHGYNTAAVGKWHLAPMDQTSPAGPYDHWPLGKGFERYYGFLDHETDHWFPELTQDNSRVEPPARDGYHLTEDLVDRATAYVRGQKSVTPEKPLFLYLCFGACHTPHHVPRPYIERHRGHFDHGWDVERERRLARQKELGIVPPDTELAPRNQGVVAWDGLGADERRLYTRMQEVYAAMLTHTDEQIGRLLDCLAATGQLDNTLIMAISDNGASMEGGPNGSLNCTRYITAGSRESLADLLGDLDGVLDKLGGPESFPHYPWGWAQASNTPLKWYKQYTYGGGVRDPLIVHWPAGIDDRGGLRHQYHHVVDLMPTVLEVAGVEPPATLDGVPQKPVEGTSLAYTFAAAPTGPTRKRTQYYELTGNRGIWHDGWKAVTLHRPGARFEDDGWELYHLAEDFAELRDLAGQHPEKLRELQERWWVEAAKYDVLPISEEGIRGYARRGWFSPYADVHHGRETFTYYPPIEHLPSEAAPDTRDRSYSITAAIDRPAGTEEGVIVAFGGRWSGYTLYVQGGRLVHEYNLATEQRFCLSSDRELPAGRCTVRFEFERTGRLCGRARLLIDGQPAGAGEIPRMMSMLIAVEGLDVGRDSLTPVSPAYASPFAFEGRIDHVTFELAPDQGATVEPVRD